MTSLATPNAIKLPGEDGFFFAGPWKQLRMFSFVHIPFECGMIALGFLTTWIGGFFCPCHGSMFDIVGRVFKGVPAPTNLKVPPHNFRGNILTIGEDKGTA